MTIQDIIQDWYQAEVLDPNSADFMFCPYCNKRFYRTHFYKHVNGIHNRSFEEMIEECCLYEPLPLCPYPGCDNVLMLRYPTKLGGRLQNFCCKEHSASFNMTTMRNNPELRAKHAQDASKRLRDNNPSRKPESRRKASETIRRLWESDGFREKVSEAARKNINRLLGDSNFLEKKAAAASRRMTRMNKDKDFRAKRELALSKWVEENPDFVNKRNMLSAYVHLDKPTCSVYLVVYEKYIKLGVSSNPALRLRHLYGFKEENIWKGIPRAVAVSIEYWIKENIPVYTGEHTEASEYTEIFPASYKDKVKEEIEDRIKANYIDTYLKEWLKTYRK